MKCGMEGEIPHGPVITGSQRKGDKAGTMVIVWKVEPLELVTAFELLP